MGEFLKLVALGATAAAAVVVAKEVIERSERGEDCSPVAVIKGIGRKIGDLCREKDNDDAYEDYEDYDDFDPLSILDDDEGVDFDTTDMESDKLDGNEYVQLEIEITPEAEAKPEADEAEETEAAVEEALKNAAGFDSAEEEELGADD